MKNEVVGGITGITRAKKKSYVYTKLIAMLIAMLKKLIVMLKKFE